MKDVRVSRSAALGCRQADVSTFSVRRVRRWFGSLLLVSYQGSIGFPTG